MNAKTAFSSKALIAGLSLAAGLLAVPAVQAAVLNYSFTGVAGAGSSMDLGNGAVDLSGITFTAFGHTLNDADLFNGGVVGDGIGFFAATTTYDFGALGSFTTDAGGDFYGQNCFGVAAVSCALLSDVMAAQGFRIDFAPAFAGDPDFGIAIGFQSGVSSQINTRIQFNGDGDTLTITSGGRIIDVNATARNAVPEPSTLAIAGLALLGLGVSRRRQSAG